MWGIEYARYVANHFTYTKTSDFSGVKINRDAEYDNVMYSSFACWHRRRKLFDMEKGRNERDRVIVIDTLNCLI